MNNIPTVGKQKVRFSVAIKADAYQKLINDTLGDKEVARKFIAEVTTCVAQNKALAECDTSSIVSAGLLASALNLSLAPTLGYCYIIPYKTKATFQLGYKGLIQLAQRSNQFQKIGVRTVHQGEYIGQDKFGDDLFKFSHDCDNNPVVGYYAYFVLTNGFEKTLYWTVDQVKKHASTYSMSYRANRDKNLWTELFDFMAEKTVLKLLLNRYAPLSTELQQAILADQAVVKEDGTYEYVDNQEEKESVGNANFDVPDVPVDEEIDIKEEEAF